MKGKDGKFYSLGRYICMEFDASPKLKDFIMHKAQTDSEALRVYTHKVKDEEYLGRVFQRMANDVSPFKDPDTVDPKVVRELYSFYSHKAQVDLETREQRIRKDPDDVHAYLTQVVRGKDDAEARNLVDLTQGQGDREQMKKYMLK